MRPFIVTKPFLPAHAVVLFSVITSCMPLIEASENDPTIPPAFGKNPGEVILVIDDPANTAHRDCYKILRKMVPHYYTGKYEFTNPLDLKSSRPPDKTRMRYYLDFESVTRNTTNSGGNV